MFQHETRLRQSQFKQPSQEAPADRVLGLSGELHSTLAKPKVNFWASTELQVV